MKKKQHHSPTKVVPQKPQRTDVSKENPALHLLYMKWACEHLKAIDECIHTLSNFSNLNLHDSIQALLKERMKLVKNNQAYTEAHELNAKLKVGLARYLPQKNDKD